MRTQRRVQENNKQAPRNGLLAFRVLNALPYSNSVKDLYNKTKESSDVLKVGINFAESCAMTVSSPFLNKYAAIDRYAASQLEKLEDKYGVDLVAKSVGAVAYPIGYGIGLAGFARGKVAEITTPVVEYTCEVADVVIDQLLPPDYDETPEDEYRRMFSAKQSPFRRIRDRATIDAVVRLPSLAFLMSMNMFSSTLYMSMGFASMSLSRMLTYSTNLVNAINTQFEEELGHPWMALSNGDLTKLYRATLFHGVKQVNAAIDELENHAHELSQYLEDRNLPYNSEVVKYIAARLKSVERRLVRISGIRLTATSEQVTPSRRTLKPHTPRRRNLSEERLPTMILGEVDGQQEKRVTEEPKEATESKEVRKEAKPKKASKPAVWPKVSSQKFVKLAEANRKKKEEEEMRKAIEISQAKEDARRKEIDQIEEEERREKVDPNADEFGYAPVKAPSHGHLIPRDVAADLAEQLTTKRKNVPITPVNSPADALSNNPYEDILVDEDAVVRGPEIADAHQAKMKEQELMAHQRHLQKQTLHELLHEVGCQLEAVERRAEENSQALTCHRGPWHTAKHTVHAHAEEHAHKPEPEVAPIPENNPFSKLSTDTTEDPLSMGMSTM